jgi:hypothetical protein
MTLMRRQIAAVALAALTAVAVTGDAWAHHSQSQFEPEKTVSVEGTLTRLSWRNPHTLFLLNGKLVNGSDAEQEWAIEGPSPNQITRRGWGAAISKVGDKVTFTGRPRRDGKAELLLLSVTLADGKTITFIAE